MGALDRFERWPGRHGVGVVDARPREVEAEVDIEADIEVDIEVEGWGRERFALASVTKVAASLAVLVEVDAGRCALGDQVGPPGATLAHLLSHASGLGLDATAPITAPARRRIYSNVAIDLAVAHAAAAAETTPAALLHDRVFSPLGMSHTSLEGPAASGAVGTVVDLCALAGELLAPTLLSPRLAALQRSVAFEGLRGVLPGFGVQDPCDWGLGVEVKGAKHPHWTGVTWPASTIGHFGRAGGFVAVDVEAGIALATLGDEPFGGWATTAWPAFTDDVRSTVLERGRTAADRLELRPWRGTPPGV